MAASDNCQYYYGDLEAQTSPDTRIALPLRRQWWKLKTFAWYSSVLGIRGALQKVLPSTRLGQLVLGHQIGTRPDGRKESLGLKAGDWVEVKSAKEIFSTLDAKGKLTGLNFTPEMAKFCGKRFRVYKPIKNIILESTGELRSIKSPTVLLEGVLCDGKAHGNCDRSCFCFWRDAWLRKVEPSPILKSE